MLEGFRHQAATGAGGIGVGGPPGWMGGQITFAGSHLVDSARNEGAQAHKRPQRQRGRVQVVPWGREKGGPLSEELYDFYLICVIHVYYPTTHCYSHLASHTTSCG